jgi:hypothetical protein
MAQASRIFWDERVRMNDKSTRIIDTIIGKNFVPSRPIFLLTILQSLELGTPHNLKESSYGYYYECLIIQALMKINLRPEEIDAYNTYLTELAYVFFRDNTHELSSSMLLEFHEWFRVEYTTDRDLSEYDHNLIKVSILERTGEALSFRYKYVFYFFAARYLANNITTENIRKRIIEMSKRVYKVEFANIIMFLTHLSKDPFILEQILTNAKSLFSDVVPMTLETDIEVINSLSDDIPQLILEQKDVRKVRESHLEILDAVEMYETRDGKDIPDDFNIEDDAAAKSLDIVNALNLSIKTIEIIGQVSLLQNFQH